MDLENFQKESRKNKKVILRKIPKFNFLKNV
jgi:hypothetical protein